ncbi:hypothetical protein Mapa_010094 [Marchantia paleacea]|nr:hypothetical protein Mapa_010094 [Marchantia paleacea]
MQNARIMPPLNTVTSINKLRLALICSPQEELTSSREELNYMETISQFIQEFYLAWHHFPIDSTDLDPGVQACFVVGIYNITTPGFVRSCSAVVRALYQ